MTSDRVRMLIYLGIVGLAGIYVLVDPSGASPRGLGALLLAGAVYKLFETLRPSRRSLDEVADMFRQADEIRRTDPAAAQRFIDGYFQEIERRSAQQQAVLRERAKTDLGAAKQLVGLLRRDLESLRDLRRRFLPKVEPDKRVAAEASNDQRQREIQAELTELDSLIRRLQ